MNKYIEVVKRWKAGEVFSGEQLKANAADAGADADALWDAEDASHTTAAAAYAAYRAVHAAYAAVEVARGNLGAAVNAEAAYIADIAAAGIADSYIADATANADHWVKRYEDLTNDK